MIGVFAGGQNDYLHAAIFDGFDDLSERAAIGKELRCGDVYRFAGAGEQSLIENVSASSTGGRGCAVDDDSGSSLFWSRIFVAR
jgi:hypothetical protein